MITILWQSSSQRSQCVVLDTCITDTTSCYYNTCSSGSRKVMTKQDSMCFALKLAPVNALAYLI